MYSVVLMMALSGGAEVPEFGCRCNGGCSGCHGCRGDRCHGCRGCNGCHGCRGGHGCHGCRGGRCHGCNGCSGYSYGCSGYGHGCSGYTACCGTAVVVSPCACSGGTIIVPEKKDMPKKKKKTAPEVDAPAVIQVSLPADARLTVDGNATTSTSENRTFVTPALPQGETFQYTLRAEIVRDGRTVVETQVVTVRGGEETRVPFNFSNGVIAAR